MKTYTLTQTELRIVILKALRKGLKTINEIDRWIESGMPCPTCADLKPDQNIYGLEPKKTGKNHYTQLNSFCAVISSNNFNDHHVNYAELLTEGKEIFYQGKLSQFNFTFTKRTLLLESIEIANEIYYKNYNTDKDPRQWLMDPLDSLKSAVKYSYIILYRL